MPGGDEGGHPAPHLGALCHLKHQREELGAPEVLDGTEELGSREETHAERCHGGTEGMWMVYHTHLVYSFTTVCG